MTIMSERQPAWANVSRTFPAVDISHGGAGQATTKTADSNAYKREQQSRVQHSEGGVRTGQAGIPDSPLVVAGDLNLTPNCAGAPEDFISQETHWQQRELIDTYCVDCPLLEACREYAIRVDEHGVWGGMTQSERKAEAKRRGIRQVDNIKMGSGLNPWVDDRRGRPRLSEPTPERDPWDKKVRDRDLIRALEGVQHDK